MVRVRIISLPDLIAAERSVATAFCWVSRITRRSSFPAVNRGRFIVAECVLILVIVGALSLSASVIVRNVRTARLNRRLAVMHNVSGDQMEAEVAAPPVESEIQTEQAAPGAAPVTVFHRTDLDILP